MPSLPEGNRAQPSLAIAELRWTDPNLASQLIPISLLACASGAVPVRALLLDRPAGATREQLLAVGIDCSTKQLNSSLAAMCDTGQMQASINRANRIWMLTPTMHTCIPLMHVWSRSGSLPRV